MPTDSLPIHWTVRPASLEDAAAVNGLLNAASRHFTGTDRTTQDEIRAWMSLPRFDLSQDTRMVLDDSGHALGWAYLRNPGKPYVNLSAGISVAVERMADARLWDALLAWSASRAQEYVTMAPADARVSLTFSGFAEDTHRWEAAERLGAKRVRVLNRMRIDLHTDLTTPTWPNGITIRPYRHDGDLRALVMAVREVFADHWGFVETPLEDELVRWQARIAADQERFDPDLWFLAVQDAEIAGFALCSPDIGGNSSRCELDPLGVRKAWRGRGLGLAMLHYVFYDARSRGKKAVELEVDAENLTGATELYERAGMHVIRQQYFYEKELRPGIDLVKRA